RRDFRRRGAAGGAALCPQCARPAKGRVRRRTRQGTSVSAARRVCGLHAGIHRHAPGRQRGGRPDGRGVRGCRETCPRRGRQQLVAGRCGGRGRGDLRDRLRRTDAMNDTGEAITLRLHAGIAEIPAEQWDCCAGDINPTVSHVFLNALEESGSVGARSGWAPQHLSFSDPCGRLLGAVPLYLKSHSYGEYVFDWGWADAYERAGGRYYPKLLCAVPFTPVPGPRLLLAPNAPAETKAHLIAGMIELARQRKLSSLHVNFPSEEEAD